MKTTAVYIIHATPFKIIGQTAEPLSTFRGFIPEQAISPLQKAAIMGHVDYSSHRRIYLVLDPDRKHIALPAPKWVQAAESWGRDLLTSPFIQHGEPSQGLPRWGAFL